GLDPNTTYDVYVTSVCDETDNITAISTVVTFTTDGCDAVTDVAVSDESFTTATVTWTASAPANDGYIVNVYEEGVDITTATAVFTVTIADGTITTSAITGLDPNRAYDVYVTSVCEDRKSTRLNSSHVSIS